MQDYNNMSIILRVQFNSIFPGHYRNVSRRGEGHFCHDTHLSGSCAMYPAGPATYDSGTTVPTSGCCASILYSDEVPPLWRNKTREEGRKDPHGKTADKQRTKMSHSLQGSMGVNASKCVCDAETTGAIDAKLTNP